MFTSHASRAWRTNISPRSQIYLKKPPSRSGFDSEQDSVSRGLKSERILGHQIHRIDHRFYSECTRLKISQSRLMTT